MISSMRLAKCVGHSQTYPNCNWNHGTMSTFDSTKTRLADLLHDIKVGKIQLPDFQRGWVWDDEHIRSLLVSIARSFPIGAVMLLESGGEFCKRLNLKRD